MKKTTSDVLQDGLLSGFIGYGLISLYFALLNLLTGKPAWLTAQTFGDALFPGSFPGQMIAYNGAHLALFLVLGVIAAFLIKEVELHPAIWYVAMFVAIAGFILTYSFMTVIAGVVAKIDPVTVITGNVVAAAGMGAFLLLRHPGLARVVREQGEREEAEYHPA